jgi:hypothetical protein
LTNQMDMYHMKKTFFPLSFELSFQWMHDAIRKHAKKLKIPILC